MGFLGGLLLLVALAVGISLLVGLIIRGNGRLASAVSQTTRSTRPTTIGNLHRRSDGIARLSYRTKDGRADYSFSYERQSDGTWRAYIVSQPSYGGRDEGAHPTHRLSDGCRKYVCWSAPIPSFEQAKQVSAIWADATQEYIRGGKRF
jgi:hypothetical protein